MYSISRIICVVCNKRWNRTETHITPGGKICCLLTWFRRRKKSSVKKNRFFKLKCLIKQNRDYPVTEWLRLSTEKYTMSFYFFFYFFVVLQMLNNCTVWSHLICCNSSPSNLMFSINYSLWPEFLNLVLKGLSLWFQVILFRWKNIDISVSLIRQRFKMYSCTSDIQLIK